MRHLVTESERFGGFLPVPGGGGKFGIVLDEVLGGTKGFSLLVNEVSAGYKSKEHAHGEEQAWLILSGHGRIWIDGEGYEVSPGDAIIAPPHSRHQVDCSMGEGLKYALIYVPAGPEKELRERGEGAFGR